MVRFRDGVPRNKLSGQLVWFLAWVGITGFGLFLTASRELHGTHQQLGLPPCPSVAFFDRPCFGCGMTTSITSLLHRFYDVSPGATVKLTSLRIGCVCV